VRRSLIAYQRELDEKATPLAGLAPGPMCEAEESILRFFNTLTLVGLTAEELVELDVVGMERVGDRAGDRRDLVAMFMDGFLLAKYVYFREAVPVECQD
jgi:hypothetical protein